ncbi:MAG: hypothetical protein ACHREM_13595 [Polyangiales bacterium]
MFAALVTLFVAHPLLSLVLGPFVIPFVSSVLYRGGAWAANADTPASLAAFASKGKWQARVANAIAFVDHVGNCNIGQAVSHGLAILSADTVKILTAAAAAAAAAPLAAQAAPTPAPTTTTTTPPAAPLATTPSAPPAAPAPAAPTTPPAAAPATDPAAATPAADPTSAPPPTTPSAQ